MALPTNDEMRELIAPTYRCLNHGQMVIQCDDACPILQDLFRGLRMSILREQALTASEAPLPQSAGPAQAASE